MIVLYELKEPFELKYGGGLSPEQQSRCVQQTELDSPRWTPYPERAPSVENVCGKFVVRVDATTATAPGTSAGGGMTSSAFTDAESGRALYVSCLHDRRVAVDERLESVCFHTSSPFGRQRELFHLGGHVTVRCTPGLPRSMQFKGVRGLVFLRSLMRDLFLDELRVIPLVHMGVVSSCLGVRLQTSACCYLENRVRERHGWLAVEARTPDQCNVVRLSVKDWSNLLPVDLVPRHNDMVITGRGSVVHRLSWHDLVWDERAERAVLRACQRVGAVVAELC